MKRIAYPSCPQSAPVYIIMLPHLLSHSILFPLYKTMGGAYYQKLSFIQDNIEVPLPVSGHCPNTCTRQLLYLLKPLLLRRCFNPFTLVYWCWLSLLVHNMLVPFTFLPGKEGRVTTTQERRFAKRLFL